jgi:hypothetical protein
MRDTSRGQGRVFGIPTVDGAYPYEPNRWVKKNNYPKYPSVILSWF